MSLRHKSEPLNIASTHLCTFKNFNLLKMGEDPNSNYNSILKTS
jgi:hypothetical protein